MTVIRSTFLRAVIGLDAAVCGLLGAGFAVGGPAAAGALGLSPGFTGPVGLFLMAYAALLAWLALRSELPRAAVWALAVFNGLWALESVLIVRLGWVNPTPTGHAVLYVQAAGALGVAAFQALTLRRARPLTA
jgi:hypothetical protein